MWCYTARYYSETGRLTGLPGPEIEAVCRWDGEKGKAVKAMVECGWLDLTPEGDYQVHDWQEHEGHIARYKVRAKTAVAAREQYRKEGIIGKSSTRYLQDNLKMNKRAKQALPLPPSPPDPLLSPHPKSMTGQEKSSAEDGQSRLSAAGAELIRFPLPGDQGDIVVQDTHLKDWQAAFPGVDIQGQLAKMRTWLLANPKRRKTRAGIGSFIVKWLEKAQNQGPGRAAPGGPAGAQVSPEARELGFYYLERYEPGYGEKADDNMKASFCAMNGAILQGLVATAGGAAVAKRALDKVAAFKAGKPWQLKFIGDIWPEFVGEAMREVDHAGTR
jgi:hypothetical protein